MRRERAIAVLPPDVALKIAAGEVVERPASAVKELIENALDAGATRVSIDIREAGLKQIRVTDDGHGIPADQVAVAFQSHATSKIRQLDDLQHLLSLGFRGEALPSIAAIARVEIQTRPENTQVGTRLGIDFGVVGTTTSCAVPPGTRVSVSDLFANVPARRTFVRSLRAEAGQIAAIVTRYALAHPDVRFSLINDGQETFRSPGSGRVEDVAIEVFGSSAARSLIPVSTDEGGIELRGLISDPSLSRPNRSHIHLFVNGRLVANRRLVFALEEAYSGYLMTGRHPLAALHIHVPPDEVDANIHPSKSEVRFAREREVHSALHRAVESALLHHRLAERGIGSHNDEIPDAVQVDPEPGDQVPFDLAVTDTQHTIAAVHGMPALRVFGQANATFIIAEGPNGLYMIDQHAAHERILFDRLDVELDAGEVQSQPLLQPAAADLTPGQMAALEENGDLLRRAGFGLEAFGTDSCLVRAVPFIAGRTGPIELVVEVLSELDTMHEPAAARERTLAAMACKAAVKAGATLDVQEMRELVWQLERTQRPATCPHGRPTMIHLSHVQLEREFGRR